MLKTLPEEAQKKISSFLLLLQKWNQAYNLTAIRDPQEMVTKHIEDSLAVIPYIKGPKILDVGTGAGLPGIPLAIALPHLQFTLLDSNGKKIRFITQVVSELAIKNIEIVQDRVEDYESIQEFQTVVSRAFASLDDFVGKTQHLLAKDGQILAMKAKVHPEELKNFSAHAKVCPLEVSGLKEERNLVIITP